MIEAIVTLIIPDTMKLVPGSGALLSRYRLEVDIPTHTEVYRLEFESEKHVKDWINISSGGRKLL